MWLWIIATLCAFFVKGLCGFANTLVFTSILGFGVNNVNISPVELILGFPANIILICKNRKNLNRRIWLPLALLVLAGCIPGAFILKYVNAQYVKIIFGVVVVLVGIEMFVRECRKEKTVMHGKLTMGQSLLLGVIGLLSGVLCGLFGVGALLAAYVGRVTKTTDEFKAHMSAVFFVENTFRFVLYGILGVFTVPAFIQAVKMIPVVLVGLFAGIKCGEILNERVVKLIVIVLLIISGVMLVVKNI